MAVTKGITILGLGSIYEFRIGNVNGVDTVSDLEHMWVARI